MDEEQGWVPAAYLEREDGSQDDFADQPCEAGMSEMKLHCFTPKFCETTLKKNTRQCTVLYFSLCKIF